MFPNAEIQSISFRRRPPANSDSSFFRPDIHVSHLLHSLILQAQETTLLSITPCSLQMYWSSWNCFKISLCIQHSFPSFSVPVASSYFMSLKNRAIRFEFPASSFSTNSTQFRCPSSTLCNSQISLILKGLQLSESLSPPACLPIAINVLPWCLSSAPATPACFR